MQSKGNPTTAAEKKWLSTMAEWYTEHGGEIWGNDKTYAFQIHHCIGRTAKHNKVLIGPWFALPIPKFLHDVHSNHPLNITHHKKEFFSVFGSDKGLFTKMLESMEEHGYPIPFGDDVKYSIQGWHR